MDRYLTGKHLIGKYLIRRHLIGKYLVDRHLMGKHLMGGYPIPSAGRNAECGLGTIYHQLNVFQTQFTTHSKAHKVP